MTVAFARLHEMVSSYIKLAYASLSIRAHCMRLAWTRLWILGCVNDKTHRKTSWCLSHQKSAHYSPFPSPEGLLYPYRGNAPPFADPCHKPTHKQPAYQISKQYLYFGLYNGKKQVSTCDDVASLKCNFWHFLLLCKDDIFGILRQNWIR